ncbi:MAG: hypothetical protein DRP45_01685 [Candidatus Zixiibacteriota bacterium]|nr:MAG: hypothetical protein DRP45_01685 [candidate division Zixibacteria bacterium]
MRTIGIIVILLAFSLTGQAADMKYSVGGGGGVVNFTGGDFFSYDSETAIGFSFGHRLSNHWRFDIEYSGCEFNNDISVDSSSVAGGINNNAPIQFKLTRLGATFTRLLFDSDRLLNFTGGFGGGLMVWKAVHPDSGTTYSVRGQKDEPADFAASEVFAGVTAGILIRPASRVSLHISARADYLTGAGASFESEINQARDRWLFGTMARITINFGHAEPRQEWRSELAWQGSAENITGRSSRDSDGDGIPDHSDQCLNTPEGTAVDRKGCPLDSDHDGVPDGLDDCPGTSFDATGVVDINGCAVDSDFDGIPDYLDACPYSPVGALVEQNGCPIDTDRDGIPDGLDDCPHTLVGLDVDKYGCVDLEVFSTPMVLNIKYASGSFEIDPHSRERVKRLAGLLVFVQDIKLDINGYTDNIGTTVANRTLSEKRAQRVHNYLETLGVAPERMKVFGRGETNFVASNQTSEGRTKNRRIEIVFYK